MSHRAELQNRDLRLERTCIERDLFDNLWSASLTWARIKLASRLRDWEGKKK